MPYEGSRSAPELSKLVASTSNCVVVHRRHKQAVRNRRHKARRGNQAFGPSVAIAVILMGLIGAAATSPSKAQLAFNPQAARTKPPQRPNDGQMLVQANEILYDYNSQRVSAVGNVQISHNSSTLEADKVVYDQKIKRLRAEGSVRMIDADGKVTYANLMELSDDYRDGFVDSLRIDTAEATHLAARRADRTDGRYTVFQNGVYTACAACRDNPAKPPFWQVKGARIVHDQQEKMLYFEEARLEFFGVPLAYLPYFSTPDPTVKRKSGFLTPQMLQTGKTGYGFEIPYYWAIADYVDLTLSPRYTTRQGLLMQAEFRQRLINGSYEIRLYGINQRDPTAFAGEPGNRDLRGAVETNGHFKFNDRWSWGWDGTLISDKTFLSDYGLSAYKNALSSLLTTPSEATSQLYLMGVGNRSYFDARAIYFYGLSTADVQSEIPGVHPVVDYFNVANRSILGGELSYKANFTSLSRSKANFDPISADASSNGWCTQLSADTAKKTSTNCVLRGVPGEYTRLSGQADWRRSFIDPLGQMWTPFVSVRGDAINASVDNQGGVSNYVSTGSNQYGKVMPAVGIEYRYPFINVQSWGSTTIEPIAQVIIRPDEAYAGKLQNEDAQSLVFDASNLFSVNKFSGWDRVEGGGRANVGINATTQFDRGGTVNVLFGQSYQLYGLNSYAVGGLTNTGLDSGLDKAASDYVGRITYQPIQILTFSTSTRLDEATLETRRLEVEARANFDRWSVGLLYGNYAAQPSLGYLTQREGLLPTGSIKLGANWVASGGVRYDLRNNAFDQYTVGIRYVDDCFTIGVNYTTDYSYTSSTTTTSTTNHRIMLQIGLRTIGTNSFSSSIGSSQ